MPDDRKPSPEICLRIDRTVELASGKRPVQVSPLAQAYLLLLQQGGARGVSREEVFQLLWGEGDSDAARHRLRQLNYVLKQRAGAPVVETDGAVVRLADGVTVQWGTDPAWEVFPAPTPRFADRIEDMRTARHRQAAREVIQELEAARLTDAPQELLRALQRHQAAPGAWRDALWALLRTGRIREAEFELRRFFGGRLPPEGLTLGRRLAALAADQLLTAAAAGGEKTMPLMGREVELKRLSALLVQNAPSILITGVHGVGRSRFLGHALATLLTEEEDLVLLSARGHATERERAFGGLTQLLSDETLQQAHDELGQPDHEVLSRALPVRFKSRGPHHLAEIGGPGSYLRVARALESLFRRAFGAAEVLLCVDDMDEIDASTLEVITFLLRDGTARLLGTWCTEDPESDNKLLFRIQSLRAELVRLGDLDLSVASHFARTVDPGLTEVHSDEIARVAGGRPGRIVEVIEALGGGGLPKGGGPTLDVLLRRRVRQLDPSEQEVLVLLAVNQGRLPIPILADLLEVGILTAVGHARALEAGGLLRMEADDAAVVPGLLRDFIMRELPTSLRQQTHLRIADLLEETGSKDFATLGHHRLAAGRPSEAAIWFRQAAESAQDQTAYAEAIALLEKSIASADEYNPDLGGDLGRLYFGMGEFQKSVDAYEKARVSYAAAHDDLESLRHSVRQQLAELEAGRDVASVVKALEHDYESARRIGEPSIIAFALD
ncbi:MAG: AAA family ATPase, partial [Gemmatimonadota bacterium]